MSSFSSSLRLVTVSLGILAGCGVQATGSSSSSSSASAPVDLPQQEVIQTPPTQSADGGASQAPGAPTPSPSASSSSPSVGETQYKLPVWTREDVQPKSARFGQTYGLDAYSGKTIVVILLEGFCPFCRSNSLVAQQLQADLDAEKLDAQIVVLSDANATDFAGRVPLPIFRDADGKAWEEMRPGARKHDTFVFGPNGLRTYFWLGSYQGDPTRWRAEVGTAVREVAKPVAR